MSRPIVSNDSAKIIVTPRQQIDVTTPSARRRGSAAGTTARRRPRCTCEHVGAGDHVRHQIGVRQHHALGLAGRARRVDDRGELVRPHRARARRGTRAPAPHSRRQPRMAPLGHARRTACTDGLSLAGKPSIRMTASSAGKWWRTSWIFSSCTRVDTTAALARRVLQDVARLRGRKRRIDRHRHRAAPEHREVGDQPLGAALGDDRDAIARPRRRARRARATGRGSARRAPCSRAPRSRRRRSARSARGFGNRPMT